MSDNNKERKGEGSGKGEGRRETGGEKLKGFFYLLLNQLSTMQEIIKGDKKKWRQGSGERKTKGRREEGRKKERRRANITARCQANMRCWDTSTKSQRPYGRTETEDQRETAR